jgi:hypothetical protein
MKVFYWRIDFSNLREEAGVWIDEGLLLVHRFYQAPAGACAWIDEGLLLAYRFFQTPAEACVWIDA